MDKDLRDRWCAALRSGEYQQGVGYLRTGDAFCPLGVLADLIDPDEWRYESRAVRLWGGRCADLPGYILSTDIQDEISSLNDVGATFEEIAYKIEEIVPCD